GVVLYTLQNLRPDPFSADMLRLTATNGVVFLLDVARLADPVRVFDQMKLAARRMAVTLGAELVDDKRRPHGGRRTRGRAARSDKDAQPQLLRPRPADDQRRRIRRALSRAAGARSR